MCTLALGPLWHSSAVLPSNTCKKCTIHAKNVHLTLFTMGEIFIIFSIFSDIYYFSKYMKNKIGILENDIYIFPKIRKISEISCVLIRQVSLIFKIQYSLLNFCYFYYKIHGFFVVFCQLLRKFQFLLSFLISICPFKYKKILLLLLLGPGPKHFFPFLWMEEDDMELLLFLYYYYI